MCYGSDSCCSSPTYCTRVQGMDADWFHSSRYPLNSPSLESVERSKMPLQTVRHTSIWSFAAQVTVSFNCRSSPLRVRAQRRWRTLRESLHCHHLSKGNIAVIVVSPFTPLAQAEARFVVHTWAEKCQRNFLCLRRQPNPAYCTTNFNSRIWIVCSCEIVCGSA